MLAQTHSLLAVMEAVKAKIEGMKRRNELHEIGYDETHFFNAQQELEDISKRLMNI